VKFHRPLENPPGMGLASVRRRLASTGVIAEIPGAASPQLASRAGSQFLQRRGTIREDANAFQDSIDESADGLTARDMARRHAYVAETAPGRAHVDPDITFSGNRRSGTGRSLHDVLFLDLETQVRPG